MGLKDLKSNLDLVQGATNPVGEMDSIVPAGFDNGPNSTLHQDSLPIVPTTSPYQDLDGQDGPQFDNGVSSTLHTDSLAIGGPLTQDLDGNPDPNWFRWEGLTQSPFDTPGEIGGDYMIKLLENNPVLSTNSNITYQAGQNTPNDLDGQEGPQFDNGPGQTWDIHQSSLTAPYTYQHGNSSATVGPSEADANGGMPGQYSFGTDPDSPFLTPTMGGDHMVTLLTSKVQSQNTGETYNAGGFNGIPQDLNGVDHGEGLFNDLGLNNNFASGTQIGGKDLHVHLLKDGYAYQHGLGTYTGVLQENGYGHSGGAFDLDGELPGSGQYLDNQPD